MVALGILSLLIKGFRPNDNTIVLDVGAISEDVVQAQAMFQQLLPLRYEVTA